MKVLDFIRSEESGGNDILRRVKTYPKTFVSGVSAAVLFIISDYGQEIRNTQRDYLNHAFSVSEMSTEQKILAILGTNVYGSHLEQYLHINQTLPHTGLIHLYGSEMQSLESAKEFVRQARSTGIPYMFSADVEGGWVNHITITEEELRSFGLPEEFFVLRQQELESLMGDDISRRKRVAISHPLPSQEWLGRVYKSLEDDDERRDFLLLMQEYGETMARICEYIGINIMFGPVLDSIEDIDGETPIEEQDRSYGESYHTIRDLAIAYLAGVREVRSVVAVPKHFIGNGISNTDPHYLSSQTFIDPHRGTALLPFRDVINFGNELDPSSVLFQRRLQNLIEANEGHTARLQTATTQAERDRIQLSIDANNKLIEENRNRLEESELGFLRGVFPNGIDIPLIMTSNVATNLYNEPDTPTMFSETALNALSRAKNEGGLGFNGITITDDVSMESSFTYIQSQVGYFGRYNTNALAGYEALASGNELVLMRHIAGNEAYIASEIAQYIKDAVDLDQDGEADFTLRQLDMMVTRVLDLKVQVGILDTQEINGETYYVVNPHFYQPTEAQVMLDSFFSNQWPWLVRDEYYEVLGRENDQSSMVLLIKALKNFGISFYSTILNDPFGVLENERYFHTDENARELILVDKSAQYLWRYDIETRSLIDSFPIGIGSGGIGERRVIGDHRTPTGHYQIVQIRDDEWWRENKGVPLPEYYGGEDGGMLVMTGQWTPEIAIHGGGGIGFVSNGCVRVEDPMIQRLMNEVPRRSMVIITN